MVDIARLRDMYGLNYGSSSPAPVDAPVDAPVPLSPTDPKAEELAEALSRAELIAYAETVGASVRGSKREIAAAIVAAEGQQENENTLGGGDTLPSSEG
jgi:hypothetical protein